MLNLFLCRNEPHSPVSCYCKKVPYKKCDIQGVKLFMLRDISEES